MSFASRFNKGAKLFQIDTEGWSEYRDLKSLYKEDPEAVYPVWGFYINKKSQYGDSPVIISDGFYINAPKHMLETVREIMADAAAVAAINDGAVGCKVEQYKAKNYKNKVCYSPVFVDIVPDE